MGVIMAIFILPMCVQGQITISSGDLPGSGDTFRYSTTNNLTINTTTTGANANWDYKSLTATGQAVDEYKGFLSTPYFFYSQFFGATGLKTADTLNFGVLTITNVYTFYRKRSSSYTAEGTGFTTSSIPLASDYNNSDRIYKLPLTYNQHDTDYFRVATTLPTLGTFIQQGTRINHVDGWGKISTPYRNDVNCLRIKSDVLETDSLKTQFVSFGFPANRREIKWLSNSEEQPMLEITGPTFGGIFTPSLIKYRDSFRNIGGQGGGGLGPNVSFEVDKTTGLKDKDTFAFTNNTVPRFGLNFQWDFTANNVQFVNGTSSTDEDVQVVFTDTGWYDVKLTASRQGNSWDSTSAALIRIDHTSNLPVKLKRELLLIPNPVSDYVAIQSKQQNQMLDITIYNLHGKLVESKRISTSEKMNVSHLPTGRYIMKTSNGKEEVSFLFDKF